MKRERLSNDIRREQILDAALHMALAEGYPNITRDGIAKRANCACGQVNAIFNTMGQLRRAVMRSAIHHRHLDIIAQGLAAGDEVAKKADDYLKREALETLL